MTVTDEDKLAYQAAANWVATVNTVTWTLASVYVLGSAVALGTTLQTIEYSVARIGVPVVWIILSILWFIIDSVYLGTADRARKNLKDIELWFRPAARVFTCQPRRGRRCVTRCLYGTAALFLVAWLCVLLLAIDSRLHGDESIFKRIEGGKVESKIEDGKGQGDAACRSHAGPSISVTCNVVSGKNLILSLPFDNQTPLKLQLSLNSPATDGDPPPLDQSARCKHRIGHVCRP